MTQQRISVPGRRFASCGDAAFVTKGRSPLTTTRPSRIMAANSIDSTSRRAPFGGSGSRPAVTTTFRGMPLPYWGWMSHAQPNVSDCLGRPTIVQPGDVLYIEGTDKQPAMVFLVLDELHPVHHEDALCLYGYELTPDMRVAGKRKEVYVKHPDGTEAQSPTQAGYRRNMREYGDDLDGDPDGEDDGDDPEGDEADTDE